MTRCDYDAVFYRVFCITLLAIAFTFTIILTNVFVDIDGLLSRKEKGKHTGVTEKVRSVLVHNDFTTETTYKGEMIYEETEDTYRNKRSLESQNFLFHIENPKVKTILKNKLANLLEDLDEEESLAEFKPKSLFAPTRRTEDDDETEHSKANTEYQVKTVNNRKNKKKDGYLLHLALHNVLLQGIIGHMDLNEVYKRVHNLIANFKKEHDIGTVRDKQASSNSEENIKTLWKSGKPKEDVEDNFFRELVNCKDLEHQIVDVNSKKEDRSDRHFNNNRKGSNVLIKTLIDITSSGKEKMKQENHSNSKENVEGLIKLMYNGKNIKFSRMNDDTPHMPIKMTDAATKPPTEGPINTTNKPKSKEAYDYKSIPKSHMNKFIEEYFKRFANKENESSELSGKKARTKRDIKVKYENGHKDKDKLKMPKPDDDELYVEIETHFDSKGMKGEKKKKLIRNLIQKIQKAIHSDMEDDLNKKHKNLHVKKRTQNPLEAKHKYLASKIAAPLHDVIHRQINPITKLGPFQDSYTAERSAESWRKGNADYITDKSGETWKKGYLGPGFLTVAKSINSAEMSEVDVDYSKILNINGIPQRLQKPLNTDSSDEQANAFYDMGNMRFYIKDVDGTGFSIGINQFVDEPPDADSIKLFTGLENIINTYHQKYDQQNEQGVAKNDQENQGAPSEDSKADDHIVVRRSIKEKHDYHSNEYKIIFENNFLPYGSYQEIYDKPSDNEETAHLTKTRNHNPMPFVIDEDIFNKNLKPAEIFGLANLFQRKKRSINVKKITNLKSKMKLNRYLNTHAMSTKRIYMNKKRNKRQINKIRIIASDLPHIHRHSDENIYVVSDENVFADRAIVREVEAPQSDNEDYNKRQEEEYEYVPEENTMTTQASIFDGRSRHNALSSKYPHIFMEEISKSKEEEFGLDNTYLFSKLFDHDQDIERNGNNIVNLDSNDNNTAEISPKIEQVINSMGPAPPNSNIKVTVKVLPKNGTGLNSGFKEVHTSINKSYNKNGLLYSSLVNVSEISKVIKLNRTTDRSDYKTDSELSKTIKEQQDKMQFMLKQHKDHLDDQLQQLKEEKTKLESMLSDPNNTYESPDKFVELILPSNPNQIIRVSREKLGELAANSLIMNTTTTEATTLKPIPPTTVPVIDRIKTKMFRSIERNENLTYQILNKIDKNTEVLQNFLKTLTDTLVKQPPKEWKPMINFDPNSMLANKNSSLVSIPFLYAYQQPIPPHKDNVASVVYHGHIHTNTLNHEFKKPTEKPYVKSQANQTRFFIDDLENDYKVVAVRDVKKDDKQASSNTEENIKTLWKSGKPKEVVADHLFKELVNCKDLEHQIVDVKSKKEDRSDRHFNNNQKGSNVLIKILIDITTSEYHSNSIENVEGLIKLMYNGKNIKFSRINNDRPHMPVKMTDEASAQPTEGPVNRTNKPKSKPYVKSQANQTRLFIDDLENDYKVVAVRDVKKDAKYTVI